MQGKLKLRKYGIVLIASIALLILAGWLWLSLSPPSGSAKKPALQQKVDPSLLESLSNIVNTYRKIIVLIEDEAFLDARHREAASVIGKILFHENQQRLSALTEQLKAEIETASAGGFVTLPPKTGEFLNPLEKSEEWHDADKLVFRDVVNQLTETLRGLPDGRKVKAELQDRLESDRKALLEIQGLYSKELDKIFGRFETRGMVVRREAWEDYVAFLKRKINRGDIFKEYSHLLPPIAEPDEKMPPKKPLASPWNGTQFPLKTLLLTFDDGPHPRYTDRILEILKEHHVKAVFFQVGQNLGSIKKDNTFQPTRSAAASERALKEGFSLANHSQTHPFLPKLGEKDLMNEIERPNQLLHALTAAPPTLFRPPYGAQNEKVLKILEAHNLKSVLWNIDSKDWADPIPKSIANRVLREVSKQKRGIILFHDIHERTIEALPLVLETLKNE